MLKYFAVFSGDYHGVEGQREEEQPPGKHLINKQKTKH
jgi:hypothetical protein